MRVSKSHTALSVVVSCLVASVPARAHAEPPPPRPVAADRLDAPPVSSCMRAGRDVCRPRMIGGAVLLSLGIASAAAGVALTLVKSSSIGGAPAYERAYLPTGVVLIGAASQAIVFGAMLIGDAVQRKRGARARFAWRTR